MQEFWAITKPIGDFMYKPGLMSATVGKARMLIVLLSGGVAPMLTAPCHHANPIIFSKNHSFHGISTPAKSQEVNTSKT